ncbi:MAG TPA: protein-disulfide reductase DsbD N-terminal domain-containing protein, partial [Bryobacteraceae bacterium]|nr:protein-disulfide reductase DsbD N-terminal domain-containing protein [Bryobacteraceae bacterium]
MRRKSLILACLSALGLCSIAPAQKLNPIQWELAVEPAAAPPGAAIQAKLTGKLEPGWHLYSLSTPKGGPIATTINIAPDAAIAGVRIFQPKPYKKFDENFQLETETYEGEPVFLLEIRTAQAASAGLADITAQMRYQLCTDKQCLPPRKATATAKLKIDPAAPGAALAIPAGYTEFQ